MIRNPYAKPLSKPATQQQEALPNTNTVATGQKRPERPWESYQNIPKASLPAIGKPTTPTNDTVGNNITNSQGITGTSQSGTLDCSVVDQQQRQSTKILPRPQLWTVASKTIASPSSSQSIASTTSTTSTVVASNVLKTNKNHDYGTIDPRQLTLPRELQFCLDSVKPIQDEFRTLLVQNATLSQPLNNGFSLFSHQKRAILIAIQMRRYILALDMGLGKTIIGCCYARTFYRTIPNIQVIIICPVSLKEEWARTIQDVTGLSVRSLTEDSSSMKKGSKNHDNTKLNDRESVVTIVSWAKIPYPDTNKPFIVIADEAHSMQNMTSTRTKDALRLMLDPNVKGVLLLTGTPMKNGKPANLFPLLKAVKHPLGNHQRAFEAHFCGGRDVNMGGRIMWMATGASNLDQLRTLTQSHMLHMTKDECLKTLPKQTRVHKSVPVSSRSQMRHNEAMQNLSKIYENRHESASQESILGAIQKLRLVDSIAKVDATVEVAKEILNKESAVVIFTSFVEVAKLVHQKLSDSGWQGELLTGETPAKKRTAMVDNFQNGLSPVFCCTFGAGGVGLTLTAAATVILLDRPWTPGDAFQAEDRVRRIGQTKPVTSIWMSAFELDKQIDDMIESKRQTSSSALSEQHKNTVNIGNSASLTLGTSKLSIQKLLQSVFPSSGKQPMSLPDGLKQTSILRYSQGSPNVGNKYDG